MVSAQDEKTDEGPVFSYSLSIGANKIHAYLVHREQVSETTLPTHIWRDSLKIANHLDHEIRGNKFDEMVLLNRSTNSIIAIFATVQKHLQTITEWFGGPVTACLDSPVTKPEAWTGVIAETLRILSNEVAVLISPHNQSKKRALKQSLNSALKDALQSLAELETQAELLQEVLGGCSRTISSMITGCRSRFFQSVWQAENQPFQRKSGGGEGDQSNNNNQSWISPANGAESRSSSGALVNPVSGSMSTSSLLSLNLLTPYVRWDVDGISSKKQVAKSWPLIKYSSLSLQDKVPFISEILAAFNSAVLTLTSQLESALTELQEIPTELLDKQHTLLDHQFRTVLNVLLSNHYFYPAQQKQALSFGLKIRQSFQSLQKDADRVLQDSTQLRNHWKRMFRNGEIKLSTAASLIDFTNVPLWKSCKDFNFQLDLTLEIPDKERKKRATILTTNEFLTDSPLPISKQARVQVSNFSSALQEHFGILENYDESYEKSLQDLKGRTELVILEKDVTHCTDLAQQLFFHFEHISSSMTDFTEKLLESKDSLLDPVPTDPPTIPYTYRSFSPLRRQQDSDAEPLDILALMGWQAAILELLDTLADERAGNKGESGRLLLPVFRKKCSDLSSSVGTLADLLKDSIRIHSKAQKHIERISKNVEHYFEYVEDDLRVFPKLLSDEASRSPVSPQDTKYCENSRISLISQNAEGEVSIFVTVNGIFFNQFGVMFSLRLDVTTFEHRLRIAELFLDHANSQVQSAVRLLRSIREKFGSAKVGVSGSPWCKRQCLESSSSSAGSSMLIEGSLEENVFNKSLFQLIRNVEAAFEESSVKANLEMYSELEAIVLTRSSRILEKQVLSFGQACEDMSRGVGSLRSFQKYFSKSCSRLFKNSKIASPFETWNHRLYCFKLPILDHSFKHELDRILTSTASETASRTSCQNAGEITTTAPSSTVRGGGDSSLLEILSDIESQGAVLEGYMTALKEENALVLEERREPAPGSSSSNSSWGKVISSDFIGESTATSILVAIGVTQLSLNSFPKRFKSLLLRDLKSLSAKIEVGSAIISHSQDLCCRKADKIMTRMDGITGRYGNSTNKLSNDEQLERKQDGSAERDESSPPLLAPAQAPINPEESPIISPGMKRTSSEDMDVFISLGFAYESIQLCYRGYQRSLSFRSLSQKPSDQARIIDAMLTFISDHLTDFVELSRKISMVYVRINRSTRKLAAKMDQSLPLPLQTISDSLRRVTKLKQSLRTERVVAALRDVDRVLLATDHHLKLAAGFLDKHTEMSQENDFSYNDVTITVRNPYEKEIRELFTKPIRIVLPYSQFELKLW